MTDILPEPAPKFETPLRPLESDMDRLAGEIAKHRENPETKGADPKEVIKNALRAMASVPAAPAAPSDAGNQSLPAYVNAAPPASKAEVEHLLETAFKDGIAKANALAAQSNPFVLDAFHDALTGKLYPELKKRNLVD
jgi:hypothetical protein